jgi:uncharacterized membrane protein required for colicin V production
VNWVDAVIAVLVVLAALHGRSSGALRQIGSLVGLVAGFVVGTWVAPPLSVHVTSSLWRPLVAIGILVLCASLGSSLGSFVGGIGNRGLKKVSLGAFDAAGGAALGAVTSLVSWWFVATILVNLSWFSVGAAVNSSAIVTTMDKIMPPVAQIENRVLSLIREADFPQVFATVTSPPATPYPAPLQSVATATAGSSVTSVVKVLASGGCASDHEAATRCSPTPTSSLGHERFELALTSPAWWPSILVTTSLFFTSPRVDGAPSLSSDRSAWQHLRQSWAIPATVTSR